MNFPKSVRVGHLDIPIRIVSRKESALMSAPAWFDDDAVEICVREDQQPAAAAECFLHEFLHATLHASDNHDLTDEQEERVVRALTPFLLMALRDNPQLFAGLIGAVSGKAEGDT